MSVSELFDEDPTDERSIFTRNVVMNLLKIACRDNIAAAPDRAAAEAAVFREVIARIDFEKTATEPVDVPFVGEVGWGVISLAVLAMRFAIYCDREGISFWDEVKLVEKH